MTPFCLTVAFSAASLAGFGLILYAILAGSRRKRERAAAERVPLGFSDSAGGPGAALLDLDIGHEGLKHREKESFDPARHKPDLIESRKKNS